MLPYFGILTKLFAIHVHPEMGGVSKVLTHQYSRSVQILFMAKYVPAAIGRIVLEFKYLSSSNEALPELTTLRPASPGRRI
jgi:hypothetical protein